MSESQLIPAATVIILRDGNQGLETLMLRKNSGISFGGMWVFPGGKVDDCDRAASTDERQAALIAGIRETEEETALKLDPVSLVAYSHWLPPAHMKKRFSTWFFLAAASERDIKIDQGEIIEHAWMKPSQVLEQADSGEMSLAPPTWVSLHHLAGFSTCGEALEVCSTRAVEFFETQILARDEQSLALWAGDAAYGKNDPDLPGPRRRLTMGKSGFHYENTL